MSSLFSESTIEVIKKIKKVFLWTAVCILIGEVLIGAILIIAQAFDATIGRLMATFALCGVVLFIGVSNFSKMEKGKTLVQGFALVSLIANLIWLTIAILAIWEVVPSLESAVFKTMCVFVELAMACFFISAVWSIEETVKPVRPLKITALISELYCGIYGIVMILNDFRESDPRWPALAGLAGLTFLIMACAAAIVSNSGRKKSEGGVDVKSKEVQSTIQEMVEKEVQQRLKAEKEKAEREATPPLQSEDMEPEVKHDGMVEVKPENKAEAEPKDQPQPEKQPEVEAESQSEKQPEA
ncbi:hypothetical protein IKF20_01575 [Candidatus Saccharibacteria bacterium]|nr:hypothetical protein [Candidatus Saccharibacteria bacterium]